MERQTDINNIQESSEIPNKINVAVLVSNRTSGSNFQALLEAQDNGDFKNARIMLGLADSISAPALQHGRDHNIGVAGIRYRVIDGDTESYRDFFSEQVAHALNANNIKIAIMAGFNRKLNPIFFEIYKGEIWNVHPGAVPDTLDEPYCWEDGTELPWNRGKMTDDAVQTYIDVGSPVAMSTIHKATEELDFGPILERVFCEILPGDTKDSAYERLKTEEHKGLIKALKNLNI